MISTRRRSLPVVLATLAVVVLAGLLIIRLTSLGDAQAQAVVKPAPLRPGPVPPPPPGTVPEPLPLPDQPPEVPEWQSMEARGWPIQFRTNLDLLAPLGTGSANAATWFADFARGSGPRREEAEAAAKRRVKHGKEGMMVLPPDDPLLREAEPWVDQATMRFHPDIFPVEGFQTRLPNLLFILTLARSWVARGMDAADSAAAMADFHRAIRLGRLIRREDVTIIADLIGLTCIRGGTEAIYERAARDGNLKLALVAAIATGEAAPQRLIIAERLTEVDLRQYYRKTLLGKPTLELPTSKLDTIIERAKAGPDRRMRGEVILSLGIVRQLGAPAQRERVTKVLEELSRSDDPIIAAAARYQLDQKLTTKQLRELADAFIPDA